MPIWNQTESESKFYLIQIIASDALFFKIPAIVVVGIIIVSA